MFTKPQQLESRQQAIQAENKDKQIFFG
jgi:hypothetical protein